MNPGKKNSNLLKNTVIPMSTRIFPTAAIAVYNGML